MNSGTVTALIAVAVLLFILYWIIKTAVARGIQKAERETATSGDEPARRESRHEARVRLMRDAERAEDS